MSPAPVVEAAQLETEQVPSTEEPKKQSQVSLIISLILSFFLKKKHVNILSFAERGGGCG